MFRTIVVGTNWSSTAEVAFVKALDLARSSGARLHVVTASPRSSAPASGGVAGASGIRSVGSDFHADVVLEQTQERLGAGDVEVQQHTSTAEPGEAIVAIAEQVGADLIVVGTGGSAPYIRLRRTTPGILIDGCLAASPTRSPTVPRVTC